MRLRLHPDVHEEVREAVLEYNDCRSGLGDEFLAEYAAALPEIERAPLSFGRLETMPKATTVRRCLLKRFPYLIVFEVDEHEIVVLAVAHAHRRPNYWKRRR